jgi:hypothetical protein
MYFHPGWSGPTQDFGHGGYYVGDNHYGHVGHQQDRKASSQENWIVRNAKLNHPVSQEGIVAPDRYHELEASKSGSSTDQSGAARGKQG